MFETIFKSIISVFKHWVGEKIEQKVGAAPAPIQLTPEQINAIDAEWPRIKKRFRHRGLLCWMFVSLIATTGLFALALILFPTISWGTESEYDSITRSWAIGIPFIGAMIGLMATAQYEHRYESAAFRGRGELLESYQVLKTGKSGNRMVRFGLFLGAILVTAFVFASISDGERIDSQGIHWLELGGVVRSHTYDQVRSITVSTRIEAPIGIVDTARVRIGFSNGEIREITLGKGRRGNERLTKVSEFVSAQSGVPVTVVDVLRKFDEDVGPVGTE